MNKKLILRSFLHAILAVAYIFGVASLMQNGEKIFGKVPGILGPVAFLLLFVLSAAMMGILILGKPILIYLENQKRDALMFLFATIGWLFLFLILTFIFLILI